MEVPVLLVEFEGVLADTAALRASALADAALMHNSATHPMFRMQTPRSVKSDVTRPAV